MRPLAEIRFAEGEGKSLYLRPTGAAGTGTISTKFEGLNEYGAGH